jgi:site-specific DNA-methyltransferase (adenine-specific)
MEQLDVCGFSVKELELLIPNKSAHHWFRYSSDYRIPTEQNYKRLQEITGCFQKPYSEIRQMFFREKNNLCTFNSGVLESDILYGKLSKKRVHPTQKPVVLLEKLLLAYSNEGDTVLDNCMGSGSTGVACVNLNRNFIGMELEEEYFEIAKERIYKAESEDKE